MSKKQISVSLNVPDAKTMLFLSWGPVSAPGWLGVVRLQPLGIGACFSASISPHFPPAEQSVPVTPPSGPLERLDWGLSVCEGWWRSEERGLERSWIGLQVTQTWVLVLALLP